MKFAIVDKCLQIQAETPAEVLETLKHFRLDIAAHVDAIASGMLTHTAKPGSRDNGEWFACDYTAPPEFLAPYFARLQKLTGYAGPIPSIDAPRYEGHCVNLCHTHIVETASISPAGYRARGFICSADWNGRTAAERAPGNFAEYICEKLGDTRRESEFIEIGNGGLLKRNPNYLKRHAPHAALTNVPLFSAVLQWWIDTQATQAQKDVLQTCDTNHRSVCKNDALGAHLIRSYDDGYRVAWDKPLISFAAFQAMGVQA